MLSNPTRITTAREVPQITAEDLAKAQAVTVEMNRVIGAMNDLKAAYHEMNRDYEGLAHKLESLQAERKRLVGREYRSEI